MTIAPLLRTMDAEDAAALENELALELEDALTPPPAALLECALASITYLSQVLATTDRNGLSGDALTHATRHATDAEQNLRILSRSGAIHG